VGWGGGVSVDQYIADEIAKDVLLKYRSLEMGVQVKSATVWSRMSYRAPDNPVPPREDPNQNFTDFFSDLQQDPFQLELIRKKRKSVLDAVIEDSDRLNARLGKDDRVKLDNHLEAIRSVEKRLDAQSSFGAACEVPAVDAPGESNFQQNDF